MVWSFLWRFVFIAMVLVPAANYAAGFLVGVSGGGHSDARNAGFVVEAIALIFSMILAIGFVQNLRK